MKLSDAVICSVVESTFFSIPIIESEEGPRWQFGYQGKRVNDPHPDILLLGAYKHPSTGNNLVGGVNLNYMTDKQRTAVAHALPEIMKQGNLKKRYWAGRKLVPDVFNSFYRTYNADHVRGVKKDVMYPKYGYMKTAKKWLGKKMSGIFKSKAKRQKEAEPQYPDDLQSMQDKLDQVVIQLAQAPPPEEPPNSPEMQAARDAYKDFARKKTMQDIEQQEDEPFIAARQDLEQSYDPPVEPAPIAQPEPEPEPPETYPNGAPLPIQTPEEIANELEIDRRSREANLNEPDNELNPDIDLEESIIYYSSVAGRYVVENISELVL